MSLEEFIKQKQGKIGIMEGREKEDLKSLLEKEVTINNYDFLNGDEGKYVVFTIKEDDKCFYFGSSVLTDELLSIDEAGYKKEVIEKGLKIKLEERKSKNSNRKYIAVNYL